MNAILSSQPAARVVALATESLPELPLHEWAAASEQIVGYFRQLLVEQAVHHQSALTLQLPSILELARFFDCCEMDVFDALYALKQHAYHYHMYGIDGPVFLSDPLDRRALKKPASAVRRLGKKVS